jgi:2-dehydro-3-deoxygluconokinase
MVTQPPPGRVVTLGEPLVAFISTDGALTTSVGFTSVVTGAEVNVAICLARLGHEVDFLGWVGSDLLGERILRSLRTEQVGTSYVRAVPDSTTGLLVREPAVFGPAEVLYRRGGSAGSLMDAAYVDECSAALRAASWLHVTGITPALSETCADAVTCAVERARADDIGVSLDINMRHKLWGVQKARDTLVKLASDCDVVFGDGAELALLSGTSSVGEAVTFLHRLGVKEVVLKRAAEGAVVYSATAPVLELPGVPVPDIRDLVGAGDAFVAGYLSALLDFRCGSQPATTTPDYRRGCIVAAFTMRVLGDSTGAPSRKSIASVDLSLDR